MERALARCVQPCINVLHPCDPVILQEGGLAGWDERWRDVYRLAELVVARVMEEFAAADMATPASRL